MNLNFVRVAGAYNGPTGGLAWDGKHMLFSAVREERILRFDPDTREVSEFRRYTGRTNGIGAGRGGSLYGAQEGGRRVIEFKPDGSTAPTCDLLDGKHHNQPTDLSVDSKGRVWFADAFNTMPPYGPPVYPFPEQASILRLERDSQGKWSLKRITFDTQGARALALSPDEKTLYVAEGDPDRTGPRELRAYPIQSDGSVGKHKVLHEFGAADRGIEGICVSSDGHVFACGGWKKSGPGPMVYSFTPAGKLVGQQPAPDDLPMRCTFGDPDLSSLYLTNGDGYLYRARHTGHKGVRR